MHVTLLQLTTLSCVNRRGNTSNEATQYSSNWQSPDLETKNPRQIIDQAYSLVTTMLQHDFGEVPELSTLTKHMINGNYPYLSVSSPDSLLQNRHGRTASLGAGKRRRKVIQYGKSHVEGPVLLTCNSTTGDPP